MNRRLTALALLSLLTVAPASAQAEERATHACYVWAYKPTAASGGHVRVASEVQHCYANGYIAMHLFEIVGSWSYRRISWWEAGLLDASGTGAAVKIWDCPRGWHSYWVQVVVHDRIGHPARVVNSPSNGVSCL